MAAAAAHRSFLVSDPVLREVDVSPIEHAIGRPLTSDERLAALDAFAYAYDRPTLRAVCT